MRRPIIVAALLCACPPASQTTTDGSPTTSTGAPSTTSTEAGPTTGTAPTTSSTSTPGPDLPPPCPVGSLECPCTGGGACDPGLVCEDGTCAQGCAVGSAGCPCTPGGGCDPGSTCVDGTCGEAVSPPCDPMGGLEVVCCGNGWTEPLEECDEGGYNGDTEPCTLKCKHAVCGDGVVLENVEACDGGGLCTPGCTFTSCGNGTVESHEWCEPRGDDDPECTALCGDARKIIFITSTHYPGGALGGLAGANEKCMAHAAAGGLNGEFKAWLGVSEETAPETAWKWPDVPYINVDEAIVFEGFGDICAGADILDEMGATHPGCAMKVSGSNIWAWWLHDWYQDLETCEGWTNTEAMGTPFAFNQCSTNDGMPCSELAPIICVEQ